MTLSDSLLPRSASWLPSPLRWRASALVALLAAAGAPSLTAQVDVTITTDNAYVFGYGSSTAIPASNLRGRIENLSAGAIFNCNGGPEQYLNVPIVANGHLYVIAWSDNGVTQGVLGEFAPSGGGLPFYTGNSSWQVFATGLPYSIGSGGPSLEVINAQIVLANGGNGGLGSSGGWVGVGNNASGTVGALAIGEDNTAGGTFPQVCTSAIDVGARWMWYDPAPGVTPDPFRAPVAGEFLIFRIPTSQAAVPLAVHLSKDIENRLPLDQPVGGVEMLLAGVAGRIADVDLGPMANFESVPQGQDTLLRWTGGSIPRNQPVHLGLTLIQSSVMLRGIWLLDPSGYRVGCVHQVNGELAMSPTTGGLTFANTVTECESLSLYAGFAQVEWFANEVPLEQMNRTAVRTPLRTDLQPITAFQLAPGARTTVAMPVPPVGGNYALLSYRVGTNSSLSSGVTRDWIQFTTAELLARVAAAEPQAYGKGCPASGAVYEQFLGQGSFGLSGRSLRFSPQNGDYRVSAGSGLDTSWQPADALILGNGGVAEDLSFGPMGTFPFGYCDRTTVDVHAAGLLAFGPMTSPLPTTPSLATFLGQSPAIAAAWSTWRLQYGGGSGTVYWTTTASHCLATWVDVRAVSSQFAASTFQVKLYANGDIELNYGATVDPDLRTGSNVISGLSMGNGAPVASYRLANALTVPFSGYVGAPPMLHQASGAPRFGSMVELFCNNVPDGSIGGAFVLGFTPFDLGIDLAPLGMPDCAAHVSMDLLNPGSLFDNTLRFGLAVPFAPDLAGLVYYTQTLSLTPGRNAFGGFVSNAVTSGRIGW